MSEFEKKLRQGIHDSRWTGKVAGFWSHGGVREHPIQPDDQNVNPERGRQVVVFTGGGLAEHDRQVAERTWDAAIAEACEQGTIQIPDNPHRKK